VSRGLFEIIIGDERIQASAAFAVSRNIMPRLRPDLFVPTQFAGSLRLWLSASGLRTVCVFTLL
jgi:hypothetical protein